MITQTGPVSSDPLLSVTPSEFSGIPYQGATSGLRTNVTANRYWDSVWSPSVFMRYGPASWSPGSAPNWTGYVDGMALSNGTPLPRTDILFINTNSSDGHAQKVVHFHQNPAPPATQAPLAESISVLDPTNSGGAADVSRWLRAILTVAPPSLKAVCASRAAPPATPLAKPMCRRTPAACMSFSC